MIIFTLKQAREYREKTQEDMAKALSIHPQTYAKLEKNPEEITLSQLKQIVLYLKIPYNQLSFLPMYSS